MRWNAERKTCVPGSFQELGWAHIAAALPAEQVDAVTSELIKIMQSPKDNLEALYFFGRNEQARRLVRVERIWESISALREGDLGRYIIELAEDALDGDVSLFKDKVNVRYSGSKGYDPHQDAAAGWDSFATRFVSIGIFLDPSDLESGGFEVASAFHTQGRFQNSKGKMSLEHFRTLDPVAVTAEKGDIILLDGEAPHRTTDNQSREDKMHLLLTFAKGKDRGIRKGYYDEKMLSFGSSRVENTYEFRVFEF